MFSEIFHLEFLNRDKDRTVSENVLKASKILGGVISVVSIVGVVAFALGIQSMFSVIQTGMPVGGSISLDPEDPTVFQLTPTNTGILDATLEVSIEFILDGEMVAEDSFSLTIPAGSQIPTELVLALSETGLPEVTADSIYEIVTDIKIASLFDYISFDLSTNASGGFA